MSTPPPEPTADWRSVAKELALPLILLAITLGVGISVGKDVGTAWIQDIADDPLLLIILGLASIIVLALGCPGSPVVVLCGVFLGPLWGFLAAFTITYSACWPTWWMGRRGYTGPIDTGDGSFRAVRRLAAMLSRTGWKAVALARLTPGLPFAVVNYMLGRCGIPPRPYAAGTLVGMVPGTMVLTYAGDTGRRTLSGDQVPMGEWALVVVGFVVLAMLGIWLQRRLRTARTQTEV